jgi:hypothetical protein
MSWAASQGSTPGEKPINTLITAPGPMLLIWPLRGGAMAARIAAAVNNHRRMVVSFLRFTGLHCYTPEASQR